jgi:hypothetical protein
MAIFSHKAAQTGKVISGDAGEGDSEQRCEAGAFNVVDS